MLKIDPQPPTAFATVQVSDDYSHSWCLTNQAAYDLPQKASDWLNVRKPFPGAEPKKINGVWYWVQGRIAMTDAEHAKEAVRLLLPLAEKTFVAHCKKTEHRTAEVDGELEHWTIDAGCEENCPGCRVEKERDRAVLFARQVLEKQA